MVWANSHKTERAKAKELTPNIWLVHWQGGDYTCQRKGAYWMIRSRATGGVIRILTEKEGLGKEEAIAWIENNV